MHAITESLSAFDALLPGMPPGYGWLALVVILLLGIAAIIDLRLKRIPDALIALGLLLVLVTEGIAVDWPFAGQKFLLGFITGITLYGINELWFRFKKHDALGMGDAKWTALAVTTFGITPSLIAWVVGAWLGLAWLLLLRLSKKAASRVPFAPFLLLGLLGALYWTHWR